MNLEKPPVSPPVSIPPPVSNNNGYLPSQSFGQAPSTVSPLQLFELNIDVTSVEED